MGNFGMKYFTMLVISAVFVSITGSALASNGLLLTDLGVVYTSGEKYGISNNGEVIRNYLLSDGTRASVWRNGASVDLKPLGTSASFARGINNLGQVVGASYTGDAFSYMHAALWSNGNVQDLGTLDSIGKFSSEAYDINDFGQVVGKSYN